MGYYWEISSNDVFTLGVLTLVVQFRHGVGSRWSPVGLARKSRRKRSPETPLAEVRSRLPCPFLELCNVGKTMSQSTHEISI